MMCDVVVEKADLNIGKKKLSMASPIAPHIHPSMILDGLGGAMGDAIVGGGDSVREED
jgi:hypothetical protein